MSILSLFGCSSSASSQKEPSFDEIAQLIVDAFEENSVDPIQGILSESALATGDLQDGLSYGHSLIEQHEDIRLKYQTKIEDDQWIPGGHSKSFRCAYDVLAGDKVFKLRFEYFPINQPNPENKGLYRIYLVPEEVSIQEYEKRQSETDSARWNYGATYERAGIYNPAWQLTPPPGGYAAQRY